MNSKISLDPKRFLRDLNELRKIGAFKTGVHRPTYSAEDMEGRRWVMERMEEVGLEPVLDGIGNVLGRRAGPGPRLLVGSHIESQNEAGVAGWCARRHGRGGAGARRGWRATSSGSRTRKGITGRTPGRARLPGC